MLSCTASFFDVKVFKQHSLHLFYLQSVKKVLCSVGEGWGPLFDQITLEIKPNLFISFEINATEPQRM